MDTKEDTNETIETMEPCWDEQHNDPKADVILVSEDNVYFRVHSWYFKQKSAFIRDLLSIPSIQSLEASPIPIDQLSRHIRLFIDMIYSSNTANPIVPTIDYKPLIHISEQLQAAELQDALWNGLRDSLSGPVNAPYSYLWDLFGMAAREDNNLVCSAICKTFFDTEIHFDQVCSQQADWYDGIPSRYLATLLTGHFRWSHEHGGRAAYKQRDFYDLAHRFATMKEGNLDLKTREGAYVCRPY